MMVYEDGQKSFLFTLCTRQPAGPGRRKNRRFSQTSEQTDIGLTQIARRL